MPTIHSSSLTGSYHVHNPLLRAAVPRAAARIIALNKQSHANHSFQLWSLFGGCTVSYHNLLRAVVLQQLAAACALLNERSHANHSFRAVHL
jgi:hypothetical protein